MLSEVRSSQGGASLPPRAGIAMLTLQLRAALQEATAAEAGDSARQQLRARLDGLMEARREALELALTQAEAEAAETVAAARRAASVMLAMAAPLVNGTARSHQSQPLAEAEVASLHVPFAPPIEPPAAFPPPVVQIVEPEPPAALPPPVVQIVEPEPIEIVEPEPIELIVTPSDDLSMPIINVPRLFPDSNSSTATHQQYGQLARIPSTSNLVIDAEAFAKVFATVVATMLDERAARPGVRAAVAPAQPPAPVKQSFWTHAKHPDVILLGLTTAIVLVVLAAWLA